MIYTKQFLIDAFIWRYAEVLETYDNEHLDRFVTMITNHYDNVGKEKFRVSCSLDAEAIKIFKLTQLA